MAGEILSESSAQVINTVQNVHPTKIEVKFDRKTNFGMWHCEMYDALLVPGLEETIDENMKPA